ncbi:predicted protein [Pyrenophora tritici-repentis Pt-1C-BFP]|uniref:Uncharacterized protein n=2 Tax=Pyrenophora tritici-repentis TaxID=45151 RepID=A0A922T2Y3_9PLEO|nr:uncharacterized protein PTRG_00027 [Pyrenophora tritici-repentis Pt-1C-BFP]EDU39465.1 predicted protein [Pyrenophora tritici-repentis Pt-1C-BFP]KAI1519895.1 hypothetical protein Ptr86124_000263 [Pyrenophora tritici-repentis]KAI1687112.1 hypothetical protein KJE20_00289 [Pyrenophora tritici-repentis]
MDHPPQPPPPRRLPKVSNQNGPIPPPPPPPQGAHVPIDKITFMRSLIAENTKTSEEPFKPCYMFFYGSLISDRNGLVWSGLRVQTRPDQVLT